MKTLTEAQGMHVDREVPYRGYVLDVGEDAEGFGFVRVYVLTDRGREHLRTFPDPDGMEVRGAAAFMAAMDWIDGVRRGVEEAAHRAALAVVAARRSVR